MKVSKEKEGGGGGRGHEFQSTEAKDLNREELNFSELFPKSLIPSVISAFAFNPLFVRLLQCSPTASEKLASCLEFNSRSAIENSERAGFAITTSLLLYLEMKSVFRSFVLPATSTTNTNIILFRESSKRENQNTTAFNF